MAHGWFRMLWTNGTWKGQKNAILNMVIIPRLLYHFQALLIVVPTSTPIPFISSLVRTFQPFKDIKNWQILHALQRSTENLFFA